MKLIRLNIYCEILGHFESLEILNNLYARWKNCEIQVDLQILQNSHNKNLLLKICTHGNVKACCTIL